MSGERKTLKIVSVATATVTEEWTWDVPADFELDVEDAAGFLASSTPEGVVFIGCTDDVTDERDREVTDTYFLEA